MNGPPADRIRRALLIALAGGLIVFELVQPGNPYDEAEHLHVAWLMAVRGLRPISDFFEHHPPLLWHVLSVPFRLGVKGPEVLYLARVFVVGCGAIWCWALARLARGPDAGEEKPGAFALVLFGLILLLAQQLFITRPETLAAALLGGALLCWTSSRAPIAMASAAGVLAMLSACASPRFLLLAPVFLLCRRLDGRRLAAGAIAALAALAAFFAFACPPEEWLFDLRFSSLLQHVGLAAPAFSLLFLAACLFAAVAICGFSFATRAVPARPAALWIAHGLAIWGICLFTSGKYPYAQAFAPALLWTTLFAAWLEAQQRLDSLVSSRGPMLTATVLGALAVAAVQIAAASVNQYNVPSITAGRRLLLDLLPPGARVLLLPQQHPITVDDASYWGSLLPDDSPGKMCEAVDRYREIYPQSRVRPPPCDLVADLRRARPAVVSRDLFVASPPLQIDAVRAEIAAHYQVTDALDAAPGRGFSANTLFRKP